MDDPSQYGGDDSHMIRYDLLEINYPDMSWLDEAMREKNRPHIANESDALFQGHSIIDDDIILPEHLASEIANFDFTSFNNQGATSHADNTGGYGGYNFPIGDLSTLDSFSER